MKIETAIENLQVMIDCNEKYEALLAGEDDSDEELRDTELTLETLRMAVRALEEKPRWIPCSERLPEMHEVELNSRVFHFSNVILFSNETGVHSGVCEATDGKPVWCMEGGFVVEDATAWMPLPEAYGEED